MKSHNEQERLVSGNVTSYSPIPTDEESGSPTHPEIPLSFTSNGLFFTWFNHTIAIGKSRKITKSDMLDLPDSLKSREIFGRFCEIYKASSLQYEEGSPKTNGFLWDTIHSMIFYDFWLAGFYRLLNDILLLLSTYLIKLIVTAAAAGDSKSAMLYAGLIMLSSLLQAVLLQLFINGAFICGSTVVAAITSSVFYSSQELRLHKSNPPLTVGQINNIQSKDAASLRDFIVFFHNLWACPLVIFASVGLLFYMLGSAGIVSCVLLALLVPIETYVAKKAKAARKAVLKHSDARMTLINEMIDGIKTVKLTNLSSIIYNRISQLRTVELSTAWDGMVIQIANTIITRSGSLLITLITFAVYAGTSSVPLTADRAFAALAIIGILGRPMQVIPTSVTMLSDALVSLRRIEDIVNQARMFNPTLLTPAMFDNESSSHLPAEIASTLTAAPSTQPNYAAASITFDHVTSVRLPSNTAVVKDICCQIDQPGLVVILGPNASGKSSLLLTILNELVVQHGSVTISPESSIVAYSGHEAWILNTTAKENILLSSSPAVSWGSTVGSQSLAIRYDSAIAACCLQEDISSWVYGDDTLIGEKGINISGGQKQRLSLARALCSEARVFLLDAPLAGLDALVAQHVFREAIIPAAKVRLVIVTSCTADLLPSATRIIVLSEGHIAFDGDYAQLTSEHPHLLRTVAVTSTDEVPEGRKSQDTLSAQGKSIPVGNATITDVKSKGAQRAVKDDITENVSSVSSLYMYAQACNWINIAVATAFTLASYSAAVLGDYQLAAWTDGKYSAQRYLLLYGAISAVVIVFNLGRYFMYSYAGITASKSLHDNLLKSVLGATFRFFTEIPSGRIASRFSVDFSSIDFDIPNSCASVVDACLGIVTGVLVVVISYPLYLVVVLPLTWKYLDVQGKYRAVSKELKKIDSSTKAPLFSHFREMLTGLETMRAYRLQHKLALQHHVLLDQSIQARLNWDAANRWLGVRLDIVGALIVSAAAFSVALSSSASGGIAGLMLSYAMKSTQSLSYAIRASTALENMMTSVERVEEYISHVEQEDKQGPAVGFDSGLGDVAVDVTGDDVHTSSLVEGANDIELARREDKKEPKIVVYGENVFASYSSDLEPALKGIDFSLYARRLVGVAGRTGGGKSTLGLLLARALPSVRGQLKILDLDYNRRSLAHHRSVVQVFPQDAFIFSGTVRQFLDPLGLFSDSKLTSLLADLSGALAGFLPHDSVTDSDTLRPKVEAQAAVSAAAAAAAAAKSLAEEAVAVTTTEQSTVLSLSFAVTAGGQNMSAGQRQVLVLARAALSTAPVVVLDEITTNMDPQAARKSVQIMKRELVARGAAVLLIAHGLEEVRQCDEVWVMGAGRIVEQGAPTDLLRNPHGVFSAMLQAQREI